MKYIYRGRAATAARGASASSVRRVFFQFLPCFFVYLFLTHITRVAWTFCEHLFTQCYFRLFFVPPPLPHPPSLMSCCFALFFARNILIVARELGTHQTFFLGQLSVLGKGQYLGHRDCDSLGARFEPLVSSRKIREKIKKTTKKCCCLSGAARQTWEHTRHIKVRTRGVPEAGHEAHHQPPHPFFFFLLSTKRGVREKKK